MSQQPIFIPTDFAQQLTQRDRNILLAHRQGICIEVLAADYAMSKYAVRRVLERARLKESMDMLRAAGITPIPGHAHYVPRDDATGTGGVEVYVPLTPQGNECAPALVAASRAASPPNPPVLLGHRNQDRCSCQDGYRHWPRMLLPVARLVQRVCRFACGTSVGVGDAGGTQHSTNGGSAPTDGGRP